VALHIQKGRPLIMRLHKVSLDLPYVLVDKDHGPEQNTCLVVCAQFYLPIGALFTDVVAV